MRRDGGHNFNDIINQIIEKSLFTHKQVEIIIQTKDPAMPKPTISRGAYYRLRKQAHDKTEALFYTMILAYGLGILPQQSLNVLEQISQQVGVIFDSDIDSGKSQEIIRVLEETVKATTKMP